MKIIFLIALLVIIFLVAYTQKTAPKQTSCIEDAKICPDGSAVVRIAPDCNFQECPEVVDISTECDYDADSDKNYISKDFDECALIKFLCVGETEPFYNECGCGCVKVAQPEEEIEQPEEDRTDCTEPRPEICTLQYDPACGWFDENIKCIKYPCASTYGNSCQACSDENVAYWTPGDCPT